MSRTEITPVEGAATGVSAGQAGRRIKIMLVTVGLGVGGTETQILEMASRLDRARFEVLVCGLKKDRTVADELRARGIRAVTLDGCGKGDIRVLYRLARLIRAERPDIVHAFLGFANLASSLVGRLLGVPVIIWSYRDMEVWKTKAHWLVDRAGARWADAITCCSEAVRQFVLAHINGQASKLVTIHNGVDPDAFRSPRTAGRGELMLRDGGLVVGTVCRLDEPKKGLAVLLHALSDLAKRDGLPAWQCLVVGEGPARGSLLALAAQLSLSDRVVFAGMRHDVAPVLSAMDLFVCPSLYEGFGIAIVEAMAAGRPVIASAVGGIPEIVVREDTGLLVPPGDARALAGAIASLLSRPDRARAMGARGRERARERFSIEAAVRRHQQLYDTLSSRRPGRVRAARGAEARSS
jgi:glycosyltransferase involved in cell wall biosynthesis